MSRTKHHNQDQHYGHDYGGRYMCNKHYGQSYGKDGRKRAHKEMRIEGKKQSEGFDGI